MLFIEFAQHNPKIQLRFLETAVNNTNNQNDRMSRFVYTQTDFENLLIELGYKNAVENKLSDIRPSCLYDINGCVIKLIKFFCNNSCENCPEDKTCLWLTSTGRIKKCSFRNNATPVENWQYNKIAKQLEVLF